MQVNNWPIYVALPCPWCRGKGYQTAYLVSTGHVACKECGIELPVEAWGTLSHAAELARAVERLEPALVNAQDRHGIAWLYILTNYTIHGTKFSGLALEGGPDLESGKQYGYAPAPTFAAALIALAEQVQDAT